MSANELEQRTSGVNAPDPIEVDRTAGTTPKPDFDSSPDVAVDGSIKRSEDDTEPATTTGQSGLVARVVSWIR